MTSSHHVTARYPVPAVAAVAVSPDRRVLLAKAKAGPFAGRWLLPGAPLEGGLDWKTSLARTFEEETGIRVREATLVGIYSDTGETHRLVASFRVVPEDGALRPGGVVEALEWFALDSLPEALHPPDFQKIKDALEGGKVRSC